MAADLHPGERIIDGEVLYSSAWLGDRRDELDQLSGVTTVLGGDLDDENGYCVSCWCEIPNHGYPRRCVECHPKVVDGIL